MRKRNKKSRLNRQQGNQTIGRKAFKVERLEARRMMAGDTAEGAEAVDTAGDEVFHSYVAERSEEIDAMEDHDKDRLAQFSHIHSGGWYSQLDKDVFEAADNEGLLGYNGGAKTFEAKQRINELLKKHTDGAEKAASEGGDTANDTANTAKGIAERMREAQDDDNTVGWHTGFLGIPYKNLEDTTPDGDDDEGGITWAWEDGDGESGHGAIDEDDKLTWAWNDDGENKSSNGNKESSDGNGQEEGSSGDDEGSEEESSEDEDEEDGIHWFWEDDGDDDDDEDDEDDDEGDGQSRQTEDSRDSDPRRSGSGPDPRQGGLGRPGGDSKTDPTPYRGAIVQGGNSDPSDPDSGRSGPGVGPEHPTAGAIDYGPDGKPVDYQGYLPPKELLVQGGDSDPPKNSEHLAVDSVFSDLGADYASTVVEATVMKVTGQKLVDLGGNLPTF